MNKIADAAIIGAGYGGLIAAYILCKNGLRVTVLERQDAPGKKLLLTGNGRCNLTNLDMTADKYFSADKEFIKRLLEEYPVDGELKFLNGLSLFTKEKNGYVYPVSNQASTVSSVLVREIKKNNGEIICNACVESVEKKDDCYIIDYGQKLAARFCIMATGGKAGVYKENEINGFGILKKFGLSLNLMYPALVQTICEGDLFFKKVSGVRTDAQIGLYIDGERIGEESGELQLTDKGLSGIPVFQLTPYIGAALTKKDVRFVINYLPSVDRRMVEERVMKLYNEGLKAKLSAEKTFEGMLNRKLISALLALSHISPDREVSPVIEDKLKDFINNIFSQEIKVKGLNDFSKAQISVGGLDLKEINGDFEVKSKKGLYVIGEALDVSGKCGGYNLHFAYMSASKCASAILDALGNRDN